MLIRSNVNAVVSSLYVCMMYEGSPSVYIQVTSGSVIWSKLTNKYFFTLTLAAPISLTIYINVRKTFLAVRGYQPQ